MAFLRPDAAISRAEITARGVILKMVSNFPLMRRHLGNMGKKTGQGLLAGHGGIWREKRGIFSSRKRPVFDFKGGP